MTKRRDPTGQSEITGGTDRESIDLAPAWDRVAAAARGLIHTDRGGTIIRSFLFVVRWVLRRASGTTGFSTSSARRERSRIQETWASTFRWSPHLISTRWERLAVRCVRGFALAAYVSVPY